MAEEAYDLIIVGSGAAGLAAGIYAGRYKMSTLIIGKEFGGETATAGTIFNYPGAKAVDGYELMKTMKDQAKDVGARIMDGEVGDIKKENGRFEIVLAEKKYYGNAIILTMGAKRRRLGLPKELELTGRGVNYCVTCDGPLYGNSIVGMVGGGDASVKGIIDLANYGAKKMYLIVRGKDLRAEPINSDEMKALGDKVEILFETSVTEFLVGTDGKLSGVKLNKPYNGSDILTVDGLFVEIGAEPNSGLVKNLGVELDERGYLKVDNLMSTNVDGVYAAGDATNFFGAFKQDITAAAGGAVAATSAYNYYKKNANKTTN